MVIQKGNNDDQSRENFRLTKKEILRGYNTYQNVIKNSISVSTGFLKAFVNLRKEPDIIDSIKSPPVTAKVMVGFIIAKKKIKKAYQRNRIRRLIKESYRLNKNQFQNLTLKINVIFSLNEKGYEHFIKNPKEKLEFVNKDMIKLQKKINQHTFTK